MGQELTHGRGGVRIFRKVSLHRRFEDDLAVTDKQQNSGRGGGLCEGSAVRGRVRREHPALERIGKAVAPRKLHAVRPPDDNRAAKLPVADKLFKRVMELCGLGRLRSACAAKEEHGREE